MGRTVLLVPPDKAGHIRDTYYGCWHRRKFVSYRWPPLMLSYLRAQIPDSALFDAPARGLTAEQTLAELARMQPSLVVTNMGTFTAQDDAPFLREVRQLGCAVAVFGEYATLSTEQALRHADFAVRGEPECVVPALAASVGKYLDGEMSAAAIAEETHESLCAPGRMGKRHLVTRLDSLPFPLRSPDEKRLYRNPFAKRSPFTTMLATRGCPYDCIFCTVPALYGKSFRIRSPANVLDEMEMLSREGYRELFFRDENLTLHRRFITSLCKDILSRGIDTAWMSNSRVDTVDAELLDLMAKAGCHLLKFGVESFSDETLATIKKGATASSIRRAFSLCQDAGIETVAHMMLGNPGEDEEMVGRNIEELRALGPTYASFDVALTYPETELSRMEHAGRGTAIPAERLQMLHDAAFRRFYLRPRLLMRHLRGVRSPAEFAGKLRATGELWLGLARVA